MAYVAQCGQYDTAVPIRRSTSERPVKQVSTPVALWHRAGGDRRLETDSPSSESSLPLHEAFPSLKVHGLAGDISRLEERCNWLEGRNVWLTQRLLAAQRSCVNQTLSMGGKALAQDSFEIWREALQELRLERQLDEQTRSLDKCQNMARELGDALSKEQYMRASSEEAVLMLEEEKRRALQEEADLNHRLACQQRHLELLENRVYEAESCLTRGAAHARAMVDTANEYERAWREILKEGQTPSQSLDLLEQSMKRRGEAHGIMMMASSILQKRAVSPERE